MNALPLVLLDAISIKIPLPPVFLSTRNQQLFDELTSEDYSGFWFKALPDRQSEETEDQKANQWHHPETG